MEIVCLDQNEWIDLGRIRAGRARHDSEVRLFDQLVAAVHAERVVFPLTASHVLETSKRNEPVSRVQLAETQALLSQGWVYRSRMGRLNVEIRSALHRIFSMPEPDRPKNWVLAHGFLQAFEQMDELISSEANSKLLKRINNLKNPAALYVEHMREQDDAVRRKAHQSIADSSATLVANIEDRRSKLVGESAEVRRRAYCVHLFLENQKLFFEIALAIGISIEQMKALKDDQLRSFLEDVPTLDVEARMAARLEIKTGKLCSNDLFDMQSFYTAIPYSERIVAEKGAVSLARQARLDDKYGVKLHHSLDSLLDLY